MFKLKMLRESKGLSQQELADLVGVDRVSISRYEGDFHKPNYEILMRLCAVLDTTPNELLDNLKYSSIDLIKFIVSPVLR